MNFDLIEKKIYELIDKIKAGDTSNLSDYIMYLVFAARFVKVPEVEKMTVYPILVTEYGEDYVHSYIDSIYPDLHSAETHKHDIESSWAHSAGLFDEPYSGFAEAEISKMNVRESIDLPF